MKHIRFGTMLLLLVHGMCLFSFAQTNPSAATRDYVVEVTFQKGRPFTYQRVGEWTWYGAFGLTDDWKAKVKGPRIQAVKLYPRDEAGAVKVKITLLRGNDFEVEDLVAEYALGDKKTVVTELANFGIAPFELRLVRAPATVAELPVIKNDTKSLLISVEPLTSTLPSFKATFMNSSEKPVMGFAFTTSINDVTMRSGMPKDRHGGILIAPGAIYNLTLPYPMNATTESTGEVPQARVGLRLNVLAVIFADGSYEGDAMQAARFRGYKLGEKIQLKRIIDLLRSPSTATAAAFAIKVEELSYKIDRSDVTGLAAEFPGLSEAEIENIRVYAQVSSADIFKDLKATIGKGSSMDGTTFNDAVKGAKVKYEMWLDSLP